MQEQNFNVGNGKKHHFFKMFFYVGGAGGLGKQAHVRFRYRGRKTKSEHSSGI
jgi:hypothetical protein